MAVKAETMKKEKELVLYSNGCPKCEVAKAILQRENIKFTLVDNNDEIMKKAKELNIKFMPFFTIEKQVIQFSEMHKIRDILKKGE